MASGAPYKYLIPAVTVLFLVSIFPLIFTLATSFQRVIINRPEIGTPFIGLRNYSELFANPDFINSLQVSAVYAASTVGFSFLFGLTLAVILNEKFRGNRFFRTLFIIPLTIAPVVVGFAWRFLFNIDLGLVGAVILPSLGMDVPTILGNPVNAMIAVVWTDVWSRTPLMFLILLAGLQGIPQELYRAAKVDGLSSIRQFTNITLPLLRPAMIIALMLKTIDSINSFDAIFVMTSGGPGNATEIFSILGWRTAFAFFNIGQAAALGVVMIMVSGVSIGLLIRALVR